MKKIYPFIETVFKLIRLLLNQVYICRICSKLFQGQMYQNRAWFSFMA